MDFIFILHFEGIVTANLSGWEASFVIILKVIFIGGHNVPLVFKSIYWCVFFVCLCLFLKFDVLVFLGCCNKVPQNVWL